MKYAMSKSAALKAAQNVCGSIIRSSSTSYICYVPYYLNKPDGPATQIQADSYPKMQLRRAAVVAEVALAMMNIVCDPYAVEEARWKGYTTAKDMVDYVLQNGAE